MSDIIKCKITPVWDLYPKTTSDFHVYACTTMDTEVPIKLNAKGNFVVSGDMIELTLGEEYDVELQETNSQKYGIGYKIINIKHEMPKTVEGQYAFLRTIVNENYVNTIQAAYPNEKNIVDFIRDGILDYSKLKGIGEHVFVERIQKPVLDNIHIQDALVKLSPLGVTRSVIKRLITHYGGNVALTIQKVKQNVYILCEEVSGIGFKTVDEYALKSGVEVNSPYRLNACIEYLLGKAENDGHCWLDRDVLIEQVMDEADVEYRVVSEHMKSDAFIRVKDGEWKKFYVDDTRVGLYRNYYYESKIAEYVFELLSNTNEVSQEDERYIPEIIKEIEDEFGFELTDEQKEAIYKSIHHNILIITGRAGSGKSTNLKGVIRANFKMIENMPDEFIEDEEGNKVYVHPYDTCSLSGKAAQRIIEATGLTSQAIHRRLGYNPNKGFTYDRKNRLPLHVVALDEGSMVNSFILYKLMSAIKDNGKLIILGDEEQLAPLSAGSPFIDLIHSGVVPVVQLNKVHRQAQRSGILSYANMVREGQQINKRGDYTNKTVGELQDLTLIPFERKPDIASHIVDICRKVKDRVDIMEFQVIVPMKERGDLCTKKLNIELQKIFNDSDEEGLKRNGYEFRVGDKILKRGNDYNAQIFNGTLGIVREIDLENKMAGFEFVGTDELVYYNQEDMKDIDMAYALTVHSNQGSQYENVICALDYSAYKLLSRQLVYVMMSRASKKCMFLFENEALRYAIDNNVVVDRNTFLRELLVKHSRPQHLT